MSEIRWTEAQKTAIEYRGGAAIVSAAAGSGKTAVLVQRVISLLLDEENRVSADKLVITTFTQKAAEEMKVRLDKALSDAADRDPQNNYLQEQLLRLKDAQISTISSFCLNILRRSSAALGISPDFGVADESESKLYFGRALAQVIEDFCENGSEDDKNLIYDWFSSENDKSLENELTSLYNFSLTLPDADGFFGRWLAIYKNPELYPKEIIESYVGEKIDTPLSEMNELYEDIESMARGYEKAEKYAAEWKGMLSVWQDGKQKTEPDYGEIYLKASALTPPAIVRKSKEFDNEELKEPHARMKELWGSVLEAAAPLSTYKSDMLVCAPVLEILLGLLKKLGQAFLDIKLSKNKLDFSDFELMTLKLLRDENGEPSAAAREIAADSQVIIVDEFQDSNEVQYEIFRLISDNKKNLYFVGDIKQSIYHFRGADPCVFSRLTEDPDFRVIPLNQNFRSCGEVIDSINGVFRNTMTKQLGEVDYDESHALCKNENYTSGAENKTELLRVCADKMTAAREKEAGYIAWRINKMVREGFMVSVDKEHKRPCRYGDFAVLMGSYSSVSQIYKNALTKAGVPFDAKEDDGYTDFTEIKLMLSLLKAIDNPYRDGELAAVMMRPPYLFSGDEMSEIKLSCTDRKAGIYAGLCERAKNDERARAFLEEFTELRRYSEENSAEKLIRRIYDESSIIAAIKASPNGSRRDANLKLLISYAGSFEEKTGSSLFDFITYMENISRSKIRIAQAKGQAAGADCVRLMTIHGSKGLEFPICFVANLSSRLNGTDYGIIACDPKFGIGMNIIDRGNLLKISTFPRMVVADELERIEKSESMRLLYVALTRAKEKLIITAPVKEKTKPDIHFAWVLNSAAVKNGLIEYGEAPDTDSEALSSEEADERGYNIRPFSEYADARLCRIPAKVTATQIGVKSVDDFAEFDSELDRFLRMPSFLHEKGTAKLSGKKKGDAYHKAMELLDFTKGGGSAAEQLGSLHESGRLNDIEYFSIDTEEIDAFLSSDICRRAAASESMKREFPIFCEYNPEVFSALPDLLPEDSEKPFIQGIADMFFIEDGEIVLVDYKTNRAQSDEQLIEEYRGQLAVYAAALSEMTGLPVKECTLYSFTMKRAIVTYMK